LNNLGLKLREITKVMDSKAHFSPRNIEKWVKRLPMANAGEVARRVYDTLVELNATNITVPDRFKVLGVITPSIEYLTQYLSRHYRGNAVSLNDKQRKIASLAQALESELAIGYKHIINQLITSRDKRQMGKFLVPSLVKAMHCQYLIMLRCYQLYTKAPTGLWKEIHILYQFAYNNRVVTHQAELPSVNEHCKSVDSLYKLLVLLSLSNPYQLRQKDIALLSEGLTALIDDCLILPVCDSDSEFAVVFGSDMPPVHRSIIKSDLIGVCSIEIKDCIAKVNDGLIADSMMLGTENNSLVGIVGKGILRHLIKAWGDMKSRSFKRTPFSSDVRVAIGLSSTHFMLGEEYLDYMTPKPAENNSSTFSSSLEHAKLVEEDLSGQKMELPTSKKLVQNQDADGPDLWSQMFKGNDQVSRSVHVSEQQKRVDELNEGNKQADAKYKSVLASIANMSPGGYCVTLKSEIPHQTQTGEIVGICEGEQLKANSHWNIGSIRWMKRTANNQLQLGVQLIAPNAIPVLSRVSDSKSEKMQRALMLPALKGIGQPATLITNPLGYKVKDTIRLQESVNTYDARLTKLIASTPAYKQFQFERLSKVEIKPEKEKNNDDNFNGLWEII
jgi:cyclic-di-GMP-binding protein